MAARKSRAFGSQAPRRASLAKPGSEIYDLRQDLEAAFMALEDQVEKGSPGQANIRLNTNPTAGDTISIGADVYEFLAAIGNALTAGSTVGILRGANAAASLANIIAAINQTADAATATGHGATSVVASIYNTDFLHIETADAPGGNSVPNSGASVALADGLTAAVNWDHANLSEVGGEVGMKRELVKITCTAANIANNFDVVLPFTPMLATCVLVTDASGVPSAAKQSNVNAAGGLALVQARNAVTVDLDVGAGTDPVATDIVYLEVRGF